MSEMTKNLSVTDRSIIKAFLSRHLRGDVTGLFDAALYCGDDALPFDTSQLDMAQYVRCPYCDTVIARGVEETAELLDGDLTFKQCPHCGVNVGIDEMEAETEYPGEWLLVSSSLARALFERGEIVLDQQYWGRYPRHSQDFDYVTDPAIVGICDDLEILSGQAHCPVHK